MWQKRAQSRCGLWQPTPSGADAAGGGAMRACVRLLCCALTCSSGSSPKTGVLRRNCMCCLRRRNCPYVQHYRRTAALPRDAPRPPRPLGMAWHGMAQHGLARHGTARHGLAWLGTQLPAGRAVRQVRWSSLLWILAQSNRAGAIRIAADATCNVRCGRCNVQRTLRKTQRATHSAPARREAARRDRPSARRAPRTLFVRRPARHARGRHTYTERLSGGPKERAR